MSEVIAQIFIADDQDTLELHFNGVRVSLMQHMLKATSEEVAAWLAEAWVEADWKTAGYDMEDLQPALQKMVRLLSDSITRSSDDWS